MTYTSWDHSEALLLRKLHLNASHFPSLFDWIWGLLSKKIKTRVNLEDSYVIVWMQIAKITQFRRTISSSPFWIWTPPIDRIPEHVTWSKLSPCLVDASTLSSDFCSLVPQQCLNYDAQDWRATVNTQIALQDLQSRLYVDLTLNHTNHIRCDRSLRTTICCDQMGFERTEFK